MNADERLCMLLGINPAWDDCCVNDGICEHKKSNRCTNRASWIDCDFGIDGRVYPDFYDPENFVKLLEVIFWTGDIQFYNSQQGIKCALFGDTGYFEQEQLQIKDLLIKALINQLEGTFLPECAKEVIKNKAQQVQWKY